MGFNSAFQMLNIKYRVSIIRYCTVTLRFPYGESASALFPVCTVILKFVTPSSYQPRNGKLNLEGSRKQCTEEVRNQGCEVNGKHQSQIHWSLVQLKRVLLIARDGKRFCTDSSR